MAKATGDIRRAPDDEEILREISRQSPVYRRLAPSIPRKNCDMKLHNLSKSKIIEGLQCKKRLWLTIHRPELAETSDGVSDRLQAGLKVHDVFRTVYPDGISVSYDNGLVHALQETKRLVNAGVARIFEATFSNQGVLVRADLIEKADGFYKLYEVKSSTSVKDYHINDASIQAWVISKSIPLSSVFVTHIDNSFVYQGGNDYRGLFFSQEVTEQVNTIQTEIPGWLNDFRHSLSGGEPEINPGEQCYSPFECPYRSYCIPKQAAPEYPVEILPGVSRIEKQLIEEGFVDLRDVPRDRLTNERHVRIWDSVKTGAPQIDPALKQELQQLVFPRYYLDFETIMFAIPIWVGTRPYQQLPFQYSCHVEKQADGGVTHFEFLDISGNPPMRSLAEQMIADLGTDGPIITYGHFERMIIDILIELYPDLQTPLAAMQDRIFDLLPLLRSYYYHPDMNGSWSIKKVLPTIAPDLIYDNLEEVTNGMEAQTAFLEAIHESTHPERRDVLRRHMLKYCGQDSLAMVKIIHYFRT